jgi:murein DD-endopeptidase MepM/ murein hydrolase activator NlpD
MARVRRSAAVIGLAISMGTAGIFASKPEPVHATNSTIPEGAVVNLPVNENNQASEPQWSPLARIPSLDRVTPIAPGSIEHEVKPGESLWLLARTYQTTPEAIATTNQIPARSDLMIGQTLKIPAPEQLPGKEISETSEQLDSSSDSLRETRKRLQESLVTLRSREAVRQQSSSETVIVTETTALVPDSGNPDGGIEIPVIAPEETDGETEQGIPIAVPTPDSDRSLSAQPNSVSPNDTTEPLTRETANSSHIALRKSDISPDLPVLPTPRVIVPTENQVYRVRPGDTLNTIARDLGIPPRELAKANGITNPNRIKVNQALVVPNRATQRTAKGSQIESGPPLAARPPLSFNPIAWDTPDPAVANQTTKSDAEAITATYTHQLREDIAQLRRSNPTQARESVPIAVEPPLTAPSDRSVRNPQWAGVSSRPSPIPSEQIIGSAPTNVEDYNDKLRIPVGETVDPSLPPLSNPDEHFPDTSPISEGFIWPTKGVLTSGYGWRWGRPHRGIDIAGPIGTPVVAAASGEVISAGWNSGGYGNLVKLRHADGSITFYAHNRRLLVRRGQTVEQGESIAEMGSTGFSTGPHLHFEVHPEGRGAANPIAFLPSRSRR